MSKLKTIITFLLTINLLFSCSNVSNQNVKENASKELIVVNENQDKTLFVSNIYNDKSLSELFLEKSDKTISQVTNDKQNISCLLFDKKRNGVIYGQSQKDSKTPKIIEPLVINSPGRFSKYKIVFYNFEKANIKTLLDLSNQDIIGVIQNMDFLDNGKTLAFQTHYGEVFFLELDNHEKAVKFIPESHLPNQFKFEDLYDLKTDRNHNLIFKARSGYKSSKDKSYVYNDFKYNIKTHKVEKISNEPFFFDKD